ncbi:hypothetical protein XENOCAPTIV_000529 [Xenoophorus captivus]|uniref:JmjC domain-containing protein n=1 Tax=Xenoophorus captivus TaxID=1517983 RepID=A0ABV0QXM3_9TELE
MPNILDDIIASVVENKIPPTRQSITTKLSTKQDYMTPSNNSNPAPVGTEDVKAQRKKSGALPAAIPEDSTNQYPDIPHSWLNNIRLLWLKDHRNQNNWKLYDDLMKNLPLPEYSDPEGSFNLASHLPSFFVRPDLGPRLCCAYGVLKRLEEEDLDEGVRRRLKDSSETPGALWHIYLNRDMDKVQEFLHKLCKEQGLDVCLDQDPIREQGWYLSRKQRQRLLDEHGVQAWTVVQFLGDSVLIPAGAMHQVITAASNLQLCEGVGSFSFC